MTVLVTCETSRVPHVMVELVHPHVAIGLVSLRDAKEVTLIETHHKDAKYKHAKKYTYSYLWYAFCCPRNLL